MRRLYYILKHEVLTFVRNPLMILLLVLSPVVVVGFIPQTLGNTNKVSSAIVDMDRSAASRKIVQLMLSAEDCLPPALCGSIEEAMRLMERNKVATIIFIPDGYEKTFADLNPEIKNTISHRANAVDKLIEFLKIDNSLQKEIKNK